MVKKKYHKNDPDERGLEAVNRIKQYIEENQIPQYKVAHALGVSDGSVNRWLQGRNVPSYSWCLIIEHKLKLSHE